MLRAICNHLLFPLRRFSLRWRDPLGYREYAPTVEQELLPPALLEGLSDTAQRVSLFYAWILAQVPWSGPGRELLIGDLGSKNFAYAGALYYFCKTRNHLNSRLIGLEADSQALYWNFYRRADAAQYYCRLINAIEGAGRVSYEEADWLSWNPGTRFDLLTCFFPFLFEDLSDGWGLPRRYFNPPEFYKKLIDQSSNILLFHQGIEEARRSKDLIDQTQRGRVSFEAEFQANPFLERKQPVHVLLWVA